MSTEINVQALLEKINKVPDSEFPNMLWNPAINDFGNDSEDYWRTYDESDPRLKYIKTNKKKIKNIYEFLDKLQLWQEYVDDLASEYGSIEIVLDASSKGILKEYVPNRPKLKMDKINKKIVRSGILPSRTINEPCIEYALEDVNSHITKNDINEIPDLILSNINKKEQKIIDRISKKNAEKDRVKSLMNSTSYSQFNMIADFYNNRLSNNDIIVTKETNKVDKDGFINFSAINKENENLKKVPEWMIDSITNVHNGLTWSNGRFVEKSEIINQNLIKDLLQAGYNPLYALGKKNMRKSEIKMIKSALAKRQGSKDEFESFQEYSKKKSKMEKKEAKKMKRAIANHQASNNAIASLLSSNQYNTSGITSFEYNALFDK